MFILWSNSNSYSLFLYQGLIESGNAILIHSQIDVIFFFLISCNKKFTTCHTRGSIYWTPVPLSYGNSGDQWIIFCFVFLGKNTKGFMNGHESFCLFLFYSHGTSYFLKLVFSILMLSEFFSVVNRSQILMLVT